MPLAPPALIVWHAAHFANTASPFAGSAAARRLASGTADSPPPAPASASSIGKPGFSGLWLAFNMPVPIDSPSAQMPANKTHPAIVLLRLSMLAAPFAGARGGGA